MKRPFLALVVTTVSLLLVSSARSDEDPLSFSAARRHRDLPAYVPDEVVVLFRTATSQSGAEHAIRDVGGRSARRSPFGGHYVVGLEGSLSVEEAVRRLSAMPEVEYAEPNYMAQALAAPNDPGYNRQWNMRMVNAERTWEIQTGTPSVIVAVIDTGVAYEDFGIYRKATDWGGMTFVAGYDFVNGDAHPNDDNFHGTHVASTIGEATNNGTGVVGLAYGCSIMPVKVLNSEGNGSFTAVADGVDFAVANRANIINLSLGGDVDSQTLKRAIDRATAAGVTIVAAAGNDGRGSISYPAAYSNVIAVGAVDGRKARASYSNFGSALDVVAPGGDIDRDDDNNGIADGVWQQTINPFLPLPARLSAFVLLAVDGTSQATPHVAALATLLYAQGIHDPAAIQKSIESTAEDLGAPGRDDQFGYGLIRPAEALKGLGINR